MNRIDRIFAELRGASPAGKALMPFITAGDPDMATTAALLPALQRGGASICELGFPFSDPVADGPVIQASMTRALDAGLKVADIFESVARCRDQLDLGLVAMVSYSIVHRIGVRRFVTQAKQAGIDGFIFPDLPLEESADTREAVQAADMVCSLLIAPSTPIERAQRIAEACSGFVYLMSRAGITGEHAGVAADLPTVVGRLRDVTDLPIAVGFGVSTAGDVRQVVAAADAAIVGSALVRRIADAFAEQGRDYLVGEVERFIAELAGGLTTESVEAN